VQPTSPVPASYRVEGCGKQLIGGDLHWCSGWSVEDYGEGDVEQPPFHAADNPRRECYCLGFVDGTPWFLYLCERCMEQHGFLW
jgi:hypothetical protein